MENGEGPACVYCVERTDDAVIMTNGLALVMPLTPVLLRLRNNNRHRELDDL